MMDDILRVENNVPSVYCNESRDFQLLCRLYTILVNSVKYQSDSMKYLTDTYRCKSTVLPLLQTKIGFFTPEVYDDDTLRHVISGFPIMVKNKGSLLAIQQAVNMFLKIFDIRTKVIVQYTTSETTMYDIHINDHTILIGVQSALNKGTKLLTDMMRYAMPTGFGIYIYYYQSLEDITEVLFNEDATLLFVTDGINSNVRTKLSSEFPNIQELPWTQKAVKCSWENGQATVNWNTFVERCKDTAKYLYAVYTFIYSTSDSSWRLNGEVVTLSDYGLSILTGGQGNNDTIKVALLVDELIGAVDTVNLKTNEGDDNSLDFVEY